MHPLLDRIECGELDPTQGHHPPTCHRPTPPNGYDIFKDKKDDCE